MYGVFLHVLADTLGSVAVIISSIMIKYFDFYSADPICCFLISVLILGSAIPFTQQTGRVLS
jgi:solute carrier family 30 (zinc transporter), member 5/7